MTHDPAFLAAIFAAPDDDAPRLVYADWLDEHGEPAYAELIRTQCALVRAPGGSRQERELAAREAELLAAHRREWLGPVGGRPGRVKFHRGFVRSLACDAADFAAHAADLFRLVPVVWSLEAHWWRADDLDALGACPHLRHVVGLRLVAHDPAATAARGFVASPHLAGLSRLVVPRNNLGDEGVGYLAASPHLAGLTVLVLDHNGVTAAGVQALAASPHLTRLTELHLRGHRLAPQAVADLRARYGPATVHI